jgi:protein-L-isoaspartate(D-aspartate) O-methyltransferase
MQSLIESVKKYLSKYSYASIPKVINAISKIDRREFTPGLYTIHAYDDEPVPIGSFQTCSQPSVVALIAAALDFKPGDSVLEIGLGSGYNTALTLSLIHPNGSFTSIERIKSLCSLGVHNLKKIYSESEFKIMYDNGMHAPEKFPEKSFDKIYVTAGIDKAAHFPLDGFIKLLKPSGLLLFPEENGSIFIYTVSQKGKPFLVEEIPGFTFVPIKPGKA